MNGGLGIERSKNSFKSCLTFNALVSFFFGHVTEINTFHYIIKYFNFDKVIK